METRFLKRWFGAVVLASGLVTAATGTAPAVADGTQPCTNWSATITSVTATGPGTVVVTGKATTQSANPAVPCAYDARLRGYTTTQDWNDPWYLDAVTGEAQLPATWRNGDTYSRGIALGVGTSVVCVRTPGARGIYCYRVDVSADANGNPTTPIVGRQVWPIQGPRPPGDGSVDICGNCV